MLQVIRRALPRHHTALRVVGALHHGVAWSSNTAGPDQAAGPLVGIKACAQEIIRIVDAGCIARRIIDMRCQQR